MILLNHPTHANVCHRDIFSFWIMANFCLVLIDSWDTLEQQGVGESTLPGQNRVGWVGGHVWLIFKNQERKERERRTKRKKEEIVAPLAYFLITHVANIYIPLPRNSHFASNASMQGVKEAMAGQNLG